MADKSDIPDEEGNSVWQEAVTTLVVPIRVIPPPLGGGDKGF